MNTLFKNKALCLLWVLFLVLSGCTSVSHRHQRYQHHYRPGADCAPNFKIDVSRIPNAIPKNEPRSKYGNPVSYIVNGHRYYVLKTSKGYDQTGIASWYGMKFNKQRTSSGEPYDLTAMTAASKVLPLPTYVSVKNLKTQQVIIVKVNDRGPFHENRIIDLSYVAASKLGVLPTGTALVEVKALMPDDEYNAPVMNSTSADNIIAKPVNLYHAPQIYLQLGAFRIKNNAQQLEQTIKTKTHFSVMIKTVQKNNLPIYRVQIGPISDVDNTDNLYGKIRQAGLGEPITVIQ